MKLNNFRKLMVFTFSTLTSGGSWHQPLDWVWDDDEKFSMKQLLLRVREAVDKPRTTCPAHKVVVVTHRATPGPEGKGKGVFTPLNCQAAHTSEHSAMCCEKTSPPIPSCNYRN